MHRLIIFLTTAFFPVIGCAASPANRPLETLFKGAQFVVVGKVVTVSASCDPSKPYCIPIYFISLDQSSAKELKLPNNPRNQYEKICSNVPLEIGSTYTLFIEAPTKFNTAGSDGCDLAIDFDGVFEKIGSYVYRVGSPDAKIIVNFEGAKYLTSAIVEPEFEHAISSLSKAP